MFRILAVTVFSLFLAACGKVADPQPPFIRIPLPVEGLQAAQNAYNIVLTWTNPLRNIDGSTALDVSKVTISSAGQTLASLPITGPGKPQAYEIPARQWVGTARSFSLILETSRGKTSEPATVGITPDEVPGAIGEVQAVLDQYVIRVTWSRPLENGELADSYLVRRLDRERVDIARDPLFFDPDYKVGTEYVYEIVAARMAADKWTPGVTPKRRTLLAVDRTPPQRPSGLEIVVAGTAAIVTWEANEEVDLAGYRVFRNGLQVSAALQTGNSFSDPAYQPGFVYFVTASDDSGNESARSLPVSR